MPSWDTVWIPGVAAANVLGIALVVYSWDHAYGLLNGFKKNKQKQIPISPELEQENYGPQLKGGQQHDQNKTLVPEQAVVVDVEELSLHPVILSWQDIECKVYTGDATAIKTIIHSCSGSFLPSDFVAIMGPSGAGKSTMLDVLSGRKAGQGVQGSVTLNELPINPQLANRCISYVGQEDVFMPMLTVWESLLFVAQLSVQTSSKAVRDARMNAVLETLGLARVKNSKVGGFLPGGVEVRGISGGEKRRLSIACGLLGNPSIIFLDEPTTGLDSHAALAVMRYLHSLTMLGHTIVSTIHQPRQEIFKSFDKLLVMSEGYQLFLAPPEYVIPWFHDILMLPYNKALDGTVADWLLGAIAINFQTTSAQNAQLVITAEHIKGAAEKFKQYASAVTSACEEEYTPDPKLAYSSYLHSPAGVSVNSESSSEQPSKSGLLYPGQDSSSTPIGTPARRSDDWQQTSSSPSSSGSVTTGNNQGTENSRAAAIAEPQAAPSMRYLGDGQTLYARGWWAQFWVLLKRSVLQQLRNPTEAGMRLLASSWSGIFFGLVWIRLPNEANSAQERLGLIFFVLMMICMVPFAYMAFPAADKRFFKLDSAKGLYSPSAYFMAYNCGTAPFLILNTFATGIPIYGLVGLRYEWWAIIQFNIILALHALVSNQLLVLSIWRFDAQDAAFSVATIYITFSLLVCGFYIRVSEMTLSIMRGLSWTSFSKYTFQALAYTELKDRVWNAAPCGLKSAPPGFEQTIPLCYFRPDYLLEYYDFKLPTSKSTVGLLAFYLGMSVLSYWALLRSFRKQQ